MFGNSVALILNRLAGMPPGGQVGSTLVWIAYSIISFCAEHFPAGYFARHLYFHNNGSVGFYEFSGPVTRVETIYNLLVRRFFHCLFK